MIMLDGEVHWYTVRKSCCRSKLVPIIPINNREFSPLNPHFPSEHDVVMILNGDQGHDLTFLQDCWCKAVLKVAVDGGANFVYDTVGHTKGLIPDVVTGDFDSIHQYVLDFYSKSTTRCSVIHTLDQDETDFLKSLREIAIEIQRRSLKVDRILVFGGFGGRLDHVFAIMNALLVAKSFLTQSVYLVSESQQAFLLSKGTHKIHIEDDQEIKWCSLVPVKGAVITTTRGLRWNVEKHPLEYGHLISTSNEVMSNPVHVECDGELMWTMGN